MSTFARTFGRFVIWVSWLERSRLLGHFIAWENESSHFILAQSIFDDRATAEPCIRKCPSGVILQSPTSNQMTKAEKRRTAKKSRYGFAVNYGIPMGQSTPKTWYEWQQCTENFRIWWMTVLCVFFLFFTLYSAIGSYCVRDTDDHIPPFCPTRKDDIGDSRCCLDAPEWKELIWKCVNILTLRLPQMDDNEQHNKILSTLWKVVLSFSNHYCCSFRHIDHKSLDRKLSCDFLINLVIDFIFIEPRKNLQILFRVNKEK